MSLPHALHPGAPKAPPRPLKVGIVNDLRMAAEVLRRIVSATPGFVVEWVAAGGAQAMEEHRASAADVVLMDLIMPGMDGAETTEELMKIHPCVILVVTATVVDNRGLVFAAMGKGALDAVNTPDGVSDEAIAEFRRKLVTVSRLVQSGPGTGALAKPLEFAETRVKESGPGAPGLLPGMLRGVQRVVGIGASTGGPQAIATILRKLPAELNAAVVIVQHLDRPFVPGLQSWLQRDCKLPVRLAEGNELLQHGTVSLAHSDDHLVLQDSPAGVRLVYTPEPRHALNRPSVDLFFENMARLRTASCCGVLLTGMGSDGALGLKHLHDAGAVTLAQDEASCVVYGMPRAALKGGAVAKTSSLEAIAARMVEFGGTRHAAPGAARPAMEGK